MTCVCCGNGGCGGLFGVVKCDVDCVVERGRHRGFCGWVLLGCGCCDWKRGGGGTFGVVGWGESCVVGKSGRGKL